MAGQSNYPEKGALEAADKILIVNAGGETKNILASVLKAYTSGGTAIEFIEVVASGDDTGLIVTEQFSVGTRDNPKESVFGGGDSYPVPLAFHFDYANLSGNTITGATDVTIILQSDTGSTTGLFGGITAGSAIIVMSDRPFGGAKLKMAVKGIIEPANVVGEYLRSTGVWAPALFMSSDADFPYDSKAWNIASCDSCSEQIRFGFDPDDVPTTWAEETMNINGTDYTGYFGLFRVVSPITQDATLEQMKLHTNRFEINQEGVTEYFGLGRYRKPLNVAWGLTTILSGFAPGNKNITFGSGLVITRIGNLFSFNQIDGRGCVFKVPEGLDTGIPIIFFILWQPDADTGGTVVFNVDVVPKSIGDTLDDSVIPTTYTKTETVLAGEEGKLKRTEFKILVNKLLPGEEIALGIKRDGPSGTFGGGVAVVDVGADGFFWKP